MFGWSLRDEDVLRSLLLSSIVKDDVMCTNLYSGVDLFGPVDLDFAFSVFLLGQGYHCSVHFALQKSSMLEPKKCVTKSL